MSGGPDSLALLLLANKAFPRRGLLRSRIAVATVDHGLRAESDAEAKLVAGHCKMLGIAHDTLRVTVSTEGNLQANARTARYDALAQWARAMRIKCVLTAHHAEDQAETLLMRLARGAGLRGLAAMRPRTHVPGAADILLARPLLSWRRAELAEIVTEAGWQAVADPGNTDPRFDRARLRLALAAYAGPDLAAVAASSALLREAVEALEWATDREFDECVTFGDGYSAIYRPSAPRAIRFDVVRLIVDNLGMEGDPRGAAYDRFLATLERGGIATLGGMRGDGSDPVAWHFTQAAPRRSR